MKKYRTLASLFIALSFLFGAVYASQAAQTNQAPDKGNLKDDVYYLKICAELAQKAVERGNTPFGSILVGPDGKILLEQENVDVTESNPLGHAEKTVAEKGGKKYSKDFLWKCTMYTAVEPCAMCSGAVYWSNIGKVVYGVSEHKVLELSGSDERNPTMDLPCREVFARGQKPIQVVGPVPEVEEAILKIHKDYWKKKK